jgi:NADPH:quinone reductase-like Zn-dependent oxidoreductase
LKAALFHEFGGPEVVRIEEAPKPEPGPGEVRLRVAAAALNHLDLWVRRGLPIETTMPHIGGSDVAGVVDQIGPGVTGVEAGDRVVVDPSLPCGRCDACRADHSLFCRDYRILGEHTQGGLAEFVVAPARNLMRVPDGYPLERAAAAPLAYLTAWRGLVSRAGLRSGESVLITGASGGVATAAIAIARWIGADIHAITTTPHVDRVRGLGAGTVYDRLDGDPGAALWAATGKRGVDVVFDSVGQAMFRGNVRSLARGGRLVVYGATTGHEAMLDLRIVFWKQISVLGTTMAEPAEFRAVMERVFAGDLEPVIDDVLPLERAAEAHERLENGDVFGKLVLTP